MMNIDIPHAENVFIEKQPPPEILHVVTKLMHLPSSEGYRAEAHQEMMNAIGLLNGGRNGFDGYVIHAPDQP